ncbi:MAG TPA: hypothetical protein VF364_01760, partial [Candidatus Limnocylindria bacterium]
AYGRRGDPGRLMSEGGTRLSPVGVVIAAVLLLLVALSPTLLFGESISGFGLILMGASVLGTGLLVRWGVGARARTLGTMLVTIGAVILVVGLGLTVLAVWSRGY